MKLSATRAQILNPLQSVIGVVERRQTMPILANVLLSARNNRLSITGTDLEVELVASGVRLAHGGAEIKRFPAMPGADTDAVLGDAGYSAEEIAAFKAAGVATTGLRAGRKK